MRNNSTTSNTLRAWLGTGVVIATTAMLGGAAFASSPSTPAAATSSTTATTVTSTLPLPSAPTPAPQDTCVKGQWPLVAQGRPSTFRAGDDGVYLWHDPDGGWALRATHSGPHDRSVIFGTLTANSGEFVDVHRAKDEANDVVTLSPDKRTILFRFVNYGWVDGLDFATHCTTSFTAHLDMKGTVASTSAIHLGADAASPTSNPFTIERVYGSDSPATTTTTNPV